ncbi:MAG: DEAD/DEAH box helicase, partial [Bdellovibrionales bacterium]|nr:DEAD/DEAH box helicase [Bdellovibrionales bacterium]
MSFTPFGLNPKLLDNVSALSYREPTPIQMQAIPTVMAGKDVIGLAQTGTGKTAAFLLPIIHSLLESKNSRAPRALVIAPTRELVAQIFDSFKDLSKGTTLRAVMIIGGASMNAQLRALKKGVDVVIACPGRLLDHLERKTIDCSGLQTVVLDEADHMFDMGFLPVIRKIKKYFPKQRQTLLFTATMPEEVSHLTSELVTDPITVRVGKETGLAVTVSHSMYSVGDNQKKPLLLSVLSGLDKGSAIVFTRTKRRAKGIGEFLKESGVKAISLQGNLSQNRRRDAIEGFRSGKYRVLVATDIAARGIDVSSVSCVLNFDMPDTVEAYTHRTGRTGRAERLGDALSFTTHLDRQIVRRIQSELKL